MIGEAVIKQKMFKKDHLLTMLVWIGIVLRLLHFLEGRSLWLDEAWVALRLNAQSYADIFFNKPFLLRAPNPPTGFLLVVKFLVSILGANEYALRFFPFLCGVSSILLYRRLLKRAGSFLVQFVALGLFVFSDSLIYQSAELKQYSIDLFVTLCLYGLFLRTPSPLTMPYIYIWSFAGIAAMFFSHAALFVLASVVILGLGNLITERRFRDVGRSVFILLPWAVCFVFLYLLAFKDMMRPQNTVLAGFENYLLPRPIWSGEALGWILKMSILMFKNPGGFKFGIVPMLLFVAGGCHFWRKDRLLFYLCVLPLLITFFASAFRKYPFFERLLLFLTPTLYAFIAAGIQNLKDTFRFNRAVTYSFVIFIFAWPILVSGQNLVSGREKGDVRTLMKILQVAQRSQDVVFVNESGHFVYLYYAGLFNLPQKQKPFCRLSDKVFEEGTNPHFSYLIHTPGFGKNNFYTGVSSFSEVFFVEDNEREHFLDRQQRIWMLFSHEKGIERYLTGRLRQPGRNVRLFQAKGASLYLLEPQNL